ncbi:MAG TPA: metallophosphoesterase [Flavobacteriales bacterium]|nr:metallophosphoesterase [Flavobacteriales bacterium]HNU54989.1 metallophosphoesterase [Flavobacteriales bacterium]
MIRKLGLVLSMVAAVSAGAQRSPYNGRTVEGPDSTGHYRLLIGGHFHGASTNASGFPAATVLANLQAINATGADLLLSTGDLFIRPDRDSARYATAFFDRLEVPLFNAPGNHDREGHAYQVPMPQRIGMGRDRILLFDTERDDSDIKGDQLDALKAVEKEASEGSVDRLFIISHRPVWSEGNDRYAKLFAGNTRSLTGCNYESEVLPILRRMAGRVQVYWISGSMAGRAPASLFFQPHEPNITYIQCAVRDQLRDAMLIADVDPKAIRWRLWSLTGEPVEEVRMYDADWWEARQGQGEDFHWRRIPYLLKKNLTSPVFWYGVITALLLLLTGWLFWRRARR